MPEATLANEESDGLRVLISKNFVHSQFESSNVERFLPRAALSSLFTEFKVKEELSSPSDDLIKFICTDAPKIFAIVLVTLPDISNLELTSVMKSFQSHTFKDEYLPIDNTGGLTCCFKRQFKDSSSSEKYDRHLNSLNVFEHKLLKDHIKDFLKNQWSFLAPEFPLSRELRMLDPRYILPFTETDYTTQKEGTFAKVFKAKLRADHSGVPQANGAHEVDVAIKKFKLRDNIDLDPSEISDPKSSWSHEADNMEEIGKIGSGNPCIARVIGSFSIRGNYYIIMSWASGGNLREFWRSREPTLSGDLIMQFLVQYRNLAGALTSLHQLGGSGDGLSVISLPVPVSVPQNQENSLNDEDDDFTKQDGSNWRHGDLKPENLLRQQEGEALGTLMVGDVGLAKKHLNPTSVRQSTDTRLGTLDYEPPEAFINSNAKSRTYDIWSMGCIVFETVIWLLYGPTGQSRFYAEPYNNRTGTRYYEDGFLGKVVNRNVAKWMDHILAKDPECSGESPTVLKDLLILTRDKLLVVNPPNSYADPGKDERINAEKLHKELNKIIMQAEADALYKFTNSSRERISMPEITQTQMNQMDLQPQSYSHLFREEWTFKNDNEFVLRIYDGLVQSTTPLQTSRGRQAQLCERCTSLDFLDEDFIIQDKSSFKPNETPCDLCALLYKTREKKSLEAAAVTFRIAGSALVQDNSPHLRLTIRANKESYKSAQSIQIGIPELLKGGSQPQFELCRQWLQDCIANHETCKSKEDHYPAMKELPTRLINVGSEKEPRVFLYSPGKDEGLKYIALSHPWGDENKHNHYVTNTTNIQEHEKEICQTKLPDLFKDAIKLTRELRYQYLWIDSLCIIQGDEGDFEAEASRMELVYSNADCVIAATDAKGNSDKFLITRPTRDYVEIGKNEQSRFSVCEAIDDFQKHVLEGSLNKRGWVLQERALARRIIHFTEKQMYWECGEGIRCETLTKMINEQAAFLSDPNFPLRAMNSTKGTKILFYQQLYRQYSRLEFSRPTDRCLGVAGLEQRLIKHFKVDGGFGVFQAPPERKYDEGYFGRSLLWKRGEDVDNLTPIKYDESTLPKSVPSWSWMAYDGGIDYLDESMLPFNKVTWMTKELKSPWDVTHSSLSWHTNKRGSTELRGEARRFWESSMDGKEARLFYDRESEEPKDYWFSDIRCVVIGIFEDKDKVRKSCVLLVAPRENSAYYTRIGVGLIPTSSIHPNQERVRIC